MPKLSAILFDLDGTLLNSAPDIRAAVNMMLAAHGRPILSLAQVSSMIGDGVYKLVERALSATGGVPEGGIGSYVQEQLDYYKNIAPDTAQIYPGVREMLARYKEAGVLLAVCTNKHEAPAVRILKALDLLRYFAFIGGGDSFPVRKPHAGHVLGIVDALNVSVQECVFVGDGPNDIGASRAAGLPCIAVAHGYGEGLDDLGADIVIEGFDALDHAIASLGFTV